MFPFRIRIPREWGLCFPHQTGSFLRAGLGLLHQKGAPESEGCRSRGMEEVWLEVIQVGLETWSRAVFSDTGELGVSLGSVSLCPSGL